MGFIDLSLFNQAMLAKHSWRILRNPYSLLFRILRGKYFRDGNFIKVSLGNNRSMTWRSILWGRDLFSKGYRWKVGDGRYITIDQDPWINIVGSSSPIWTSESLKNKKVCTLINGNGKWKEDMIKANFLPLDAEDIINIPLGKGKSKDEIIWRLDKKG